MAQALIVIDMQQALEKLYQKDQVVEIINKIIDQYHQNNLPVIFIQHTEPGMEVSGNNWQLLPDIHALGTDTYFNKTRPDSFYQTGLEAFLKMNHIEKIEICGAQVEFCVDTTIRVAYHLGFTIDLLIDGITTLDSNFLTAQQIKQHHLSIWHHRFAEFVNLTSSI